MRERKLNTSPHTKAEATFGTHSKSIWTPVFLYDFGEKKRVVDSKSKGFSQSENMES